MKIVIPVTLLLLAGPAQGAPAESPPVPSPASAASSTPSTLEKLLADRPVVNRTLTVEEAVEIALRESPVVRGAVEEVEAAAGRLATARAERRPWVSANLFASGGNNPNIVSAPAPTQPQMIMGLPKGPFVDGNLMVMYPLFTSGRIQAMVRQAAAQREVSRAELASQRQEVALTARSAYREAQARRALLDVWRSKVTEDTERLRIDQARYREGQIPQFYVQRDEAELAASQQEATNAERDVQLSLLQLRTVLGVGPASRIEISGVLESRPSAELLDRLSALAPGGSAVPLPAPASTPAAPLRSLVTPDELNTLLRLAERRRPELLAAGQRIRAAQGESASIRGSYGPQVNLFAMGDVLNDPNAGITAGLAASFPLYNGGARAGRLQTAAAERRRQEQEQQRLALQVAQEVTTALLNLRAAEQNVGTARTALNSAREDYRVASLRYQSGRSVSVEVLDALTARVRAESNLVQALFQYNVAGDRLLRATGQERPPAAVGAPSGAPPANSPGGRGAK